MSGSRAWRKRVGVEPTKDRLTAPPGFEVRTPHRGRFSSSIGRSTMGIRRAAKKIKPLGIHPAQIPAPHGHAMTVEMLEHLDCNLSPVVEAVAKLSGGEFAVNGPGRDISR